MYRWLAFDVCVGGVGCLIGVLYGLLFVHQKKEALLNKPMAGSALFYISQLCMTVTRLLGLTLIIWYLLLLGKIQIILFMTTFLVTFWVVVIHRGKSHDRNGS